MYGEGKHMQGNRSLALFLVALIAVEITSVGLVKAETTSLDLSSTTASLSAHELFSAASATAPVHIDQNNVPLEVTPQSSLTPAQYVAVAQVLSGGSQAQTIQLAAGGNAISGTFQLINLNQTIHDLTVPSGVTVVRDFGTTGALNISGNLVNAGTILAISSNSAVSTAVFSATNIFNQPGATLTSVLPVGGLTGFGNLVQSLNLNLFATNDIVNAGVISSSGNLNLQAGGSIINSLPAGVSGPAPLMQALQSITMNAQSLANSGVIAALSNNINISSNLRSDFLLNNLGGQIQAMTGAINIQGSTTQTILQALDVSGGDFVANAINVTSPQTHLKFHSNRITGTLTITAGTAEASVATGALTLGNITLTGDPLFYDSSGATVGLAGIATGGNPLIVVSSGDIDVTGTIDTRGPADGAQVLLVAGAIIGGCSGPGCPGPGLPAPLGDVITVTGFNSSGSISVANDIITSGTGATSSGGDVTLVAPDRVTLGGSIITTGGATNGNVVVIAGESIGPLAAISLGTVNAGGGVGGGAISLYTATPSVAGPVPIDGICTGCAGFFSPGTLTAGNIVFQPGATITSSNNLIFNSPIDVTIGANSTVQTTNGIIQINTPQLNLGAGSTLQSSSSIFLSGVGGDLSIVGPSGGQANISPGNSSGLFINVSTGNLTFAESAAGGTVIAINGGGVGLPGSEMNVGLTISGSSASLTINPNVTLQSDRSISINATNNALLVNNGVVQSTATNGQLLIQGGVATHDLRVGGSGTYRSASGATPLILIGNSFTRSLFFEGSLTFDAGATGTVDFIAPEGSVNLADNTTQTVTAAGRVEIFTPALNFGVAANIDAASATNVFVGPNNFVPLTTITITVADNSTSVLSGGNIGFNNHPNSTTETFPVRFAKSAGLNTGTLRLQGPVTVRSTSSITLDSSVVVDVENSNLTLQTPQLTLNGIASLSNVTTPVNLSIQSITNGLLPGTIIAGGALNVVSGAGGGLRSTSLGGTGTIRLNPDAAGAITIAGTGDLLADLGGVIFNGGNNPILVNANSIPALLAGSGSSVSISAATGDLTPSSQVFINGGTTFRGIFATSGSLTLNANTGAINLGIVAAVGATGNVTLFGDTGITSGLGAVVTAGYNPATFNAANGTGTLVNAGSFISLTTNGAINLAAATELAATGNVNIVAQGDITFNSLASPVLVAAGLLFAGVPLFGPAFAASIYNTNSIAFDLGSFASLGSVTITSNTGNMMMTDSFIESFGGDVALTSLTGTMTFLTGGAGGTFVFAQGGNATFNALGDITTSPGTSIGAVARIIPGGTPVQIIGNELPGYQGGDIGMVSGTIIPNFSQFLRDNFDVNRTLMNQYTPVGSLNLSGTAIPAPTNGGYVSIVNTLAAPMQLTNSSFTVDGSVIFIDPVIIDGTGFGAFGLPSNFVPLPLAVLPPAPGAPVPLAPPGPGMVPVVLLPGSNSSTILNTDTDSQNRQITLSQEKIEVVTLTRLSENMVISGSCKQFILVLKDKNGEVYATVVAAGGSTFRAEKSAKAGIEERMLSLTEGKVVIISAEKKGLNLKVNDAVLSVPPDGVSVVEVKPSGAVIAGLIIGGQKLTATVNGQELSAGPGQEFAYGAENEPEELIAADGADRQLIKASMFVIGSSPDFDSSRGSGSTGHGTAVKRVRLEQRAFEPAQRIQKEPLLKCLDCLTAKCAKEKCQRLLRKLDLDRTEKASAPADPYRPIGHFVVGAPLSFIKTNTSGSAVIKYVSGDITSASGCTYTVGSGDYIVSAKKDIVVKTENSTVALRAGTIAMVQNRRSVTTVMNLWDSIQNSVVVHGSGRKFALRPGEEGVIGPKSVVNAAYLRGSPIGRRRVTSVSAGSDTILTAEASFTTVHAATGIVQELFRSKDALDKALSEKLLKMATVLGITTARHGNYSQK